MNATWNERFALSDLADPGPPDGLVGREELVPWHGRALDAGCGRGGVAVWLAARGLDVTAVDAAPAGLALGASLAAREGVVVRWVEADLDRGLPADGPYDVVVCQRYRDPALYPALADALAPGGLLVVSVLSAVGKSGEHADRGRFRAAPGELVAAFGHLAVLTHDEGLGSATLVARRR